MTAISVGIGYVVKRVPASIETTEFLGQWLGAALLAFFGIRTLLDAWQSEEKRADEEKDAEKSRACDSVGRLGGGVPVCGPSTAAEGL